MTEPLEPPNGQDTDPPDLHLAILVGLILLNDVRLRLSGEIDVDDTDDADLVLRIGALIKVLRKIRDRFEEEERTAQR